MQSNELPYVNDWRVETQKWAQGGVPEGCREGRAAAAAEEGEEEEEEDGKQPSALRKQHIASCFNWAGLMVREDWSVSHQDKLLESQLPASHQPLCVCETVLCLLRIKDEKMRRNFGFLHPCAFRLAPPGRNCCCSFVLQRSHQLAFTARLAPPTTRWQKATQGVCSNRKPPLEKPLASMFESRFSKNGQSDEVFISLLSCFSWTRVQRVAGTTPVHGATVNYVKILVFLFSESDASSVSDLLSTFCLSA